MSRIQAQARSGSQEGHLRTEPGSRLGQKARESQRAQSQRVTQVKEPGDQAESICEHKMDGTARQTEIRLSHITQSETPLFLV